MEYTDAIMTAETAASATADPELRKVAFQVILTDLLQRGRPVASTEATQTDNGTQAVAEGDAGRYAKLAQELGIKEGLVTQWFKLDGDSPEIIADVSKYPQGTRASKQVQYATAMLVAAHFVYALSGLTARQLDRGIPPSLDDQNKCRNWKKAPAIWVTGKPGSQRYGIDHNKYPEAVASVKRLMGVVASEGNG